MVARMVVSYNIGLHEPEQVSRIAEVVSILLITVGVFW